MSGGVIPRPSRQQVGTALVATGLGFLVLGALVALPLGVRHDPLVVASYVVGLVGAVVFLGRKATDPDVWLPVGTERGETVPVPGDDRPGDWRRRCRAVLVPAIARREGVTREQARERVQAGTWTDDVVAAAALAEGVPPPRKPWLFGLRTAEPGPAEQRRRAVAAVADYVEGAT